MKKILKTFCSLSLTFGLFAGCADIDSEKNVKLSDISNELSYSNISRQAYMGGSVLYNPTNASSGHLAKGVVVAVRLGYTKQTIVDSEQATFEDIEDNAQYGYLEINSIDETSISFTYKSLDKDGRISSQKYFSLKLEESADLNGDGLQDVSYQKPQKKRNGFENASWLTFLSSKENLNTSMYAVLPEQYNRSVYPSGLIGINNNGRFIYNKYNVDSRERAAIQGISYGDYVLDSETGEYKCFVGRNSYSTARSINDVELVTFDDENVSFYYNENEFNSRSEAVDLFEALPVEITSAYSITDKSESEIVNILNELLQKNEILDAIISQKHLELTTDDMQNLATAKTCSGDELAAITRAFIDDIYEDCSPSVLDRSTAINNVLPLASFIISDVIDTEKSVDNNERAVSVNEYNTKKNALENQFAKNYKTVKTVSLSHKFSSGVDFKLENSYAKIGLTGSFNSSWGNVKAKVGGAVLLQVSADLTATRTISTGIPDVNIGGFTYPAFSCGPIVVSVKGNAKFACPIKVTTSHTINMNAGVTGLYGADVSCGASYGVKWKKKWFVKYPSPYCSFSNDKSCINNTVYHISSNTKDGSWSGSSSVSATPTFKLYLGANISGVVDAGVSANPGIRASLVVNYAKNSKPTGTAKIEGLIGISASAGVGVTIPIVNKHVGKSWSYDIVSSNPRTIATWKAF